MTEIGLALKNRQGEPATAFIKAGTATSEKPIEGADTGLSYSVDQLALSKPS